MKYSELIINAFATYTRTIDLANATQLSRQTIIKYKKDEELQKLADERRMQVVKESVYKMQSELTKCVDTLVKIRDDEENNAQVRIYACNCIMNHCKEWTLSIDVLDRLQALEALQNKS